ncbi:MAG TPA: sugar dehydrogenase complex small subunit [Verrucomicrobiae bacterium]|nr:sugar dehydrogenase complex small subunit [Verrucomicrobiae bacterium]
MIARGRLLSLAAVAAAGPLLGLETLAGCAATSPRERMDDFVRLSSSLLGIEGGKLVPDPDPLDVKSQIFGAAQNADASALDALLQTARAHRGDAAALARAALDESPPAAARLARSILLAWLLGSWYDPQHLPGSPGASAGTVLSAQAYKEAWVWRIAQTHAMGASDVGFGSWSNAPQALAHFIGND